MHKKITRWLKRLVSVFSLSMLVAIPAFANTGNWSVGSNMNGHYGGNRDYSHNRSYQMDDDQNFFNGLTQSNRPIVMGVVTGRNGNTIYVRANNGASYSINTGNAYISEYGSYINVSDVNVGDYAWAIGTLYGYTMNANRVMVSESQGFGGHNGYYTGMMPIAMGTVGYGNGNIITVYGNDGRTYTVDVSDSSFYDPDNNVMHMSDIYAGNRLMIYGTMSGDRVRASRIINGAYNDNYYNYHQSNSRDIVGAIGTVTAISGNTITLRGLNNTTYTIDATRATITKIPATGMRINSISVGDALLVVGRMTSSNIIRATRIIDVVQAPASSNYVATGVVSAISGTNLTIMGTNNTTYTVNASGATIYDRYNRVVGYSQIRIGDTIDVYGTVSGSTITATKIIDRTSWNYPYSGNNYDYNSYGNYYNDYSYSGYHRR